MKSNFIYARVAEREHGTKTNKLIEVSITKDDAPLEQRWEDKVNPNPYWNEQKFVTVNAKQLIVRCAFKLPSVSLEEVK